VGVSRKPSSTNLSSEFRKTNANAVAANNATPPAACWRKARKPFRFSFTDRDL
jgi:hypothetical protein